MHRIAYNLIRALMQRAALTYDVDLERISFKGSLDSLHHYADAIYATHRKPRKQAQLFDALLRTIASDLVPLRPERSEPRARKRRPKNYQLLTKPRKKMRTTPKPAEESSLNVAYLRAIQAVPWLKFVETLYLNRRQARFPGI